MILLIDNYDSFSYNLVQLIGGIQKKRYEEGKISEGENDHYGIRVIRNDEMTIPEIEDLKPEYIILSPGPGRPENAGICEKLLRKYDRPVKILGVCLGHQAICEAFGGKVVYARELMHGKQSLAELDLTSPVFKGLYEKIPVARYHSLAAVRDTIPDCLKVIAETEDGEVMAVQHREKAVYGLQFHPESILTPDGRVILNNFLKTI